MVNLYTAGGQKTYKIKINIWGLQPFQEYCTSFEPIVNQLVGCFGFNGPLRQYFSLYRAVSQRGRKRRKDR